jgi:hypothetical protein
MVECAKLVARDDEDVTGQAGNEVAHGVTFAQGDEKAAGALDEEVILNS